MPLNEWARSEWVKGFQNQNDYQVYNTQSLGTATGGMLVTTNNASNAVYTSAANVLGNTATIIKQ